ncbi:MAG: phosphoribosyl-ATP diphosphatase [Acidimicrobiia bacterium]|nr:phosphoribosyl-ATP diphosphatase [Acidimicrobiia bacterium]
MMIPSIDIVAGRTVQLVGGEKPAIDAGDPVPIMARFARVGEVAVVDIDAARGEGANTEVIERLCAMGSVRVGGGIRDVIAARRWLDRGAHRVVVGTAADAEFLRALPTDRVIVALDACQGEVVTHGWRKRTGTGVLDRVRTLAPLCAGVLVTFVEREGRMAGTDHDLAARIVEAAGDTRVTIAGGITTPADIASLDRIGADAQVGMALYAGAMTLADGFLAPVTSDRSDGRYATVVTDTSGLALGLVWSSTESVQRAIDSGAGVYESRTRGVWTKGETSGATQRLVRIDVDCDRDALRFVVEQRDPGFCHGGTSTCWGEPPGLVGLERRIRSIASDPPTNSNTARLLADSDLLAAKLVEEANELAAAIEPGAVVAEAADLMYFAMTKIASAGVSLSAVGAELDRRAAIVTRRPMIRKDVP